MSNVSNNGFGADQTLPVPPPVPPAVTPVVGAAIAPYPLVTAASGTPGIGPGISVPVFEGGRNRATLERAKAAYEEGVALYRQKVLVAFKEVEDSLAALQFLRGETDARAQAAAAATEAARLSFERYRAGAIAFLEVIDSENARLQNELARVRAANEQMLATVRLIKALGGGWQ